MNVNDFFSSADLESIKNSIMNAELDTSGEIRVHLENTCSGDPMERALYWFKKLEMNQTKQRNALLFYFAIKSRKFAIIGDEGIHAVVQQEFWDLLKNEMLEKFHENLFLEGLINAINIAGTRLHEYFPFQRNGANELSDEISIENN